MIGDKLFLVCLCARACLCVCVCLSHINIAYKMETFLATGIKLHRIVDPHKFSEYEGVNVTKLKAKVFVTFIVQNLTYV